MKRVDGSGGTKELLVVRGYKQRYTTNSLLGVSAFRRMQRHSERRDSPDHVLADTCIYVFTLFPLQKSFADQASDALDL
jgi:hypothetical protein